MYHWTAATSPHHQIQPTGDAPVSQDAAAAPVQLGRAALAPALFASQEQYLGHQGKGHLPFDLPEATCCSTGCLRTPGLQLQGKPQLHV